MKVLLTAAPFLLALIAAPAMAEAPNPHAGHHRAAAAEPAKPAPAPETKGADTASGCPMMQGSAMQGSMMHGMSGDASAGAGQMGQMGGGHMMMGGSAMMGGDQHMHCMDQGPAGSQPKTDEHDHSGSKDAH